MSPISSSNLSSVYLCCFGGSFFDSLLSFIMSESSLKISLFSWRPGTALCVALKEERFPYSIYRGAALKSPAGLAKHRFSVISLA